MKKEKRLHKIVKEVEGNVLAIGITDENLLRELEINEKITTCNLLNSISKKSDENKFFRRKRNFNIKKLRKKFHKKKVDYIICNMEDIYPYLKTFVKDSVYINKGKIYFYGEKNKYQLERMINKYKKYNAKVEESIEDNLFYITISNEKSKTNKMKDFWLLLCDIIYWLYEFVGDILIN